MKRTQCGRSKTPNGWSSTRVAKAASPLSIKLAAALFAIKLNKMYEKNFPAGILPESVKMPPEHRCTVNLLDGIPIDMKPRTSHEMNCCILI